MVEFAGEGLQRGLEAERVGLLPGSNVDDARCRVDPALAAPGGVRGCDSQESGGLAEGSAGDHLDQPQRRGAPDEVGLTPATGVKWRLYQSSAGPSASPPTAGPGAVFAQQQPVEPVHQLPEWLVPGEELVEGRIADQGAFHTAKPAAPGYETDRRSSSPCAFG